MTSFTKLTLQRSEQALKAGKKPGSTKRRRKKSKPPSLLDNIDLTSPKAAKSAKSASDSSKKDQNLEEKPAKKPKKAKTAKATKPASKSTKPGKAKAKKTTEAPKSRDTPNQDISLPPLPPSIFEQASDSLSSSAIEWSFGISANPLGGKEESSGSNGSGMKGSTSDLSRLTSLSPIFGDLGLGSCLSAQTGLSAFSSLSGSRAGLSPPPPIDLSTSSLLKPGIDALSLEITGHGLSSKQFYKSKSRKDDLQPEVLGMNDDLELFLIEDLIDVTPI